MSWIHKLYETYENCQAVAGKIVSEKEMPMLPICHTTNEAQIEIVIDQQGNFRRARVVPKERAMTIIPCTETSGGRTGKKPVTHPLCDKFQYVAEDFTQYGGEVTSGYSADPSEPFRDYIALLSNWCESEFSHLKSHAILKYVKKGSVIRDLVDHKLLFTGNDGKLIKKWEKRDKNAPEIFKVKGIASQTDAFIRWEVENDKCPKVWEDKTLWDSWSKYYLSKKQNKALCYVSGKEQFSTEQHPSKLRNKGDKAKLISSNDTSGFTFRGRFKDANQACGVGYEATHKAHSALRWLISRQGKVFYVKGDSGQASASLTIVAWSTSGNQIPDAFGDAFSILGEENLKSDEENMYTAQNLAIKLRNKIAGYKADLGDTSNIVVMGLDSATQGRMAITFYRELTGSEFLARLDQWHDACAWIHDYRFTEYKDNKKTKRKYIRFVGSPAPKDIAETAYGSKSSDKLKKSIVERFLPCIVDGQQIPRDIVESAVRRVCNRTGMKELEWNKALSITCALYRKLNKKEGYSMALEEDRKTRDYLYGRLLAAADCMERFALFTSDKKRDTNAARLMQRFSDRPCSTWKTIELSLSPYKARLGGRTKKYQDVIDKAMNLFKTPEDFTSEKPLSGEFLLAYHCQREALKPQKGEPDNIEDTNLEE